MSNCATSEDEVMDDEVTSELTFLAREVRKFPEILSKSQVPLAKAKKDQALQKLHEKYLRNFGKPYSIVKLQKKINNMKTRLKKKTDLKKTGNKPISLLPWERELYSAMDGDSNPTISKIPSVSWCHEITQLMVPLHADPRRAAELSCHFNMDGQQLHSVKWYRDLDEIFRYNPSQKITIRLFNVTGIMVQSGECQTDACVVRVMPRPMATKAAYTCEVSTEGPKFKIARQTKHMTVVAMPDDDPMIIGAPKVVKPGEQILVNCTSDYSLPPSDINWYIDNEIQKPEAWQHTELSAPLDGGLRASWRVMRVRVPVNASGALRIKCEALLLVEPPVVREASAIITIHSRTQLSKYVSNGNQVVKSSISWACLVSWVIVMYRMSL